LITFIKYFAQKLVHIEFMFTFAKNFNTKKMKKLFTILALTTIVFVSNAQRSTKTAKVETESYGTTTSEYKPVKGSITTEVGLVGGLGNSGFNLNTSTSLGGSPTLKFRYFYKDNIAFRLGFSANRNASNTAPTSTTVNTPATPAPAFIPSSTTFNSSTFFGINLGVEKHFKGSDRLSTFAAADLLIGTRSSYSETVNNTTATSSTTFTDKNNNGDSYFGLGLLTGADYYIAKKVYLGVELGIALLRSSDKDRVRTTQTTTGSTVNTSEVTDSVGGSNFAIATTLMGGVRIGYQF
jgi:hypothetical protein